MTWIRRILLGLGCTLALGFGAMLIAESRALAQSAAPGPSPEMQRLTKLYLGEWEYTESYEKTSFVPTGGMDTGIYTSELGPGGNSLINRFHSKGSVGDFEGMLIMTWDAREKAYKSYIFGNDFPGAVVKTGNFEGDDLVFRGEMSIGEKKISMRSKTWVGADGKMISEEYTGVDAAPEKLFVRVVAVKKP